MPDHVHFFCSPELDAPRLSEFIGAWKSWTSRKIHALGGPRSATAATALWQREFFVHVLCSNESYDQKWNYVSIIRFAREWFRQRGNGNTPERLKRLCCSRVADGGKFMIRFHTLSLTATYQACDASLAVWLSSSEAFRSLGPGPSLRHLG